jgi:hypothetical protein
MSRVGPLTSPNDRNLAAGPVVEIGEFNTFTFDAVCQPSKAPKRFFALTESRLSRVLAYGQPSGLEPNRFQSFW